jgi:hypothetical protein
MGGLKGRGGQVMPKIANDVAGGLGIGLLGIIYLKEALQLPFGDTQNPDMGYLPSIIGVIIITLCIYLIAVSLLRQRYSSEKEINKEETQHEQSGRGRLLKLMVALFLYPIGLDTIGFIIPSAALVLVFLRVMQYRNVAGSCITAILISVISYVVFSVWLGVSFPPELWE